MQTGPAVPWDIRRLSFTPSVLQMRPPQMEDEPFEVNNGWRLTTFLEMARYLLQVRKEPPCSTDAR